MWRVYRLFPPFDYALTMLTDTQALFVDLRVEVFSRRTHTYTQKCVVVDLNRKKIFFSTFLGLCD